MTHLLTGSAVGAMTSARLNGGLKGLMQFS
jgi:hypothetical protein